MEFSESNTYSLTQIGSKEREFEEGSKDGYHGFLHNLTLIINQ